MRYMKCLAAICLLFAMATPVYAGTGGTEFQAMYDWFSGIIQGVGGRTIAVLALIGAIAASAVTMRTAGIGTFLFVLVMAAFGVSIVTSMITGVV
jgi:hypothetical protein